MSAQAGDFAPLFYIVAYALATVLFLPGSILTIAGSALFGPVAGTFYGLTGATIGATLAFVVARYLASDWVARRTGGRHGTVEIPFRIALTGAARMRATPSQSPRRCAGQTSPATP